MSWSVRKPSNIQAAIHGVIHAAPMAPVLYSSTVQCGSHALQYIPVDG
jgi:hypothetical protein